MKSDVGGWAESAAVIARKIHLLVRREGLRGTLRLARHKYRYVAEFTPARRRARRELSEFDRAHGVSTSAILDPSELGIAGPSAAFCFGHQPSPPERFAEIIGGLPIRFEDFVFVDVGSGLGRALLLAAEFPFQRVVGIELSAELDDVARTNIARYASPRQRCRQIESIVGDAVTFAWPPTPLVVYLYNPFDAPVLSRVVQSLEASLAARPRDALVVYYYAKFREVLASRATLTLLQADDELVIYRSIPVHEDEDRRAA